MKIVTSFQIAIKNIFYKMIYISFNDEGSIYIMFPRKRGYLISEDLDLPDRIIGTQNLILHPNNNNVINPYISYHPRINSIHINTNEKKIYKFDSKILNLSEEKNYIAFPFCNVIISDFSFFDVNHIDKQVSPLIIDYEKIPKGPLSIEFWVLPVGMYLDKEDLPLYRKRLELTNFIGITRFQNPDLKLFSISAVLSSLKNETTNNTLQQSIIVVIFNEKQPYVFKLIPNID